MTTADLRTLWASIRDRRRGMFLGMTPEEQAAGLLDLYGLDGARENAAFYVRHHDAPHHYWRRVCAVLADCE